MALSDWNSIFQLACGFNLVLGSYKGTRKEREDAITLVLDDAQIRLEVYCKQKGIDLTKEQEIRYSLQDIAWGKMSEHELNSYRKDITNRFWSGVYKRRLLDRICGILLGACGIISLLLLFWAAVSPNILVNPLEFGAISVTLILVPISVMGRIAIESRLLDMMNRAPNKRNAISRGRPKSPHSQKRRGEIHTVTGHIRRLARGQKSMANPLSECGYLRDK